MSQKQMRNAKADFTTAAQTIAVEGYEFVGFGTEGAIFLNKSTDQYVVVKAIAKKEGYDAWEDIEAQEEKDRKAEEREAKRKEKAVKAAEKKREAEREKAEKAEQEANEEAL
jgi:hypothetical protein